MSTTKLVVHGVNYEGAHFRGIESNTDDILVKLTVEGEEQQVVDYLLHNFSYGPDESITTVQQLVDGLKGNNVPIFDGCGGLLKIETTDFDTPTVLLDLTDEFIDPAPAGEPPTPLELGLINVDKVDDDDMFDHVNGRVSELIDGAPDPDDEGDDD